MTRTLSIALLMLLLPLAVAAQEGIPLQQRLIVHVGSATPIGDFKRDRFEDDYPPLAGHGFTLQGSYARDLKPFLALGVTAGWRRNPFDLDTFAQPDDELVLSRKASAWHTGHALADVYLQARGMYWFGYLKGSLGAAHSRSPEVEVATHYGPILRTSDTATSMAYGLASGVGLQVNRVLLSLEVGRLGTNPSFEIRNAQGLSTRYEQRMSTLQYSFGLGYTL